MVVGAAMVWLPPVLLDSYLGWLARSRENSAMPHYKRASALAREGKLGPAICECDAAIRIDRYNTRAYTTRGGYYYLTKEYDAAIADCTEAINIHSRLSPNPPMDTDGRRENSGKGVRGATGEMAWAPLG